MTAPRIHRVELDSAADPRIPAWAADATARGLEARLVITRDRDRQDDWRVVFEIVDPWPCPQVSAWFDTTTPDAGATRAGRPERRTA
ncbi:MAG: hypothetical protein KC543_00785 [Myxococcales bacterium]|nr:hypothetical protein [Myxococcales bacterium]